MDLTYRRVEGETRTYLRTVLAEGKIPSGPDGSFRSELTTRETTVEVIPGLRVVSEILLARIRATVSTGQPGDPQVFDTADPPPAQEPAAGTLARRGTPLRRLAGATITIRQQPSGVIDRFEGVEALRERLIEGIPEDAPERRAHEGLASLPSLQNLLGPNLRVPVARTAVGETVTVLDSRMLPETVGMPGILYYRGEYRLASVEDGVARIEFSGEVSLDPFPGMPPWPAVFAANRKLLRLDRGVFKAWARISLERGILEEDEHRTDLDLVLLRPEGKGEIPLPTRFTRSTKRIR